MGHENSISTMHILLTGGTGFFGRALLRHWADRETELPGLTRVCVLSRNPDQFLAAYPEFSKQPWLSFHKGDVLSPNSFPQGLNFTHVLHAATDSTWGPSLQPLDRYLQIVDGTRNVLEHAVLCKASRLMLTSSGGVYGPQPHDMERVPETFLGMPDPLVPANAYSIGKRGAEHLCNLYAEKHGIEIVIARCFAFVGQDLPLDVHFAIGNFIRDALNASSSITVSGDGSPLRSYLDQRDLAVWLTRLLADGKSGQAYNVGSDEVVSISELAYLVRDLVSPDKPVRILGAPQTNKDRNRYVPDIAKIYEHLNLSPTFSLRQSILETAKIARSKGK
jgi:dTDP-glucose 4,6-dehydratase